MRKALRKSWRRSTWVNYARETVQFGDVYLFIIYTQCDSFGRAAVNAYSSLFSSTTLPLIQIVHPEALHLSQYARQEGSAVLR